MTRDERVQWCKNRALKYVDSGDLLGAVTSMASDMDQHPDTKTGPAIAMLAMLAAQQAMAGDRNGVVRFINGFN